MFHIIYVIAIMFILPFMFTIIGIKKNKNTGEIFCKWFVFWTIGVRAATTGLMQFINPAYTQKLLQVTVSDSIITQELGYAQFAIGVLGLLSLKYINYRKPAALSYGVFMVGATILHLNRMLALNLGEAVSLIGDILVVFIAIYCLKRQV